MKLSIDRLARIPRALGVAAFAAAFATFGSADTANAQRRQAGDVWQATASRGLRPVTQEHCAPIDTRVPRNFRGGHYETRYERVWVPGEIRQVWVPPVYEWRYDHCGRRIRVICQDGYYRSERAPGHYHTQAVKVWVPARRIHVRQQRAPIRHRSHRVSHVGGRFRG